jgi:hypothetical protein
MCPGWRRWIRLPVMSTPLGHCAMNLDFCYRLFAFARPGGGRGHGHVRDFPRCEHHPCNFPLWNETAGSAAVVDGDFRTEPDYRVGRELSAFRHGAWFHNTQYGCRHPSLTTARQRLRHPFRLLKIRSCFPLAHTNLHQMPSMTGSPNCVCRVQGYRRAPSSARLLGRCRSCCLFGCSVISSGRSW